MRIKELFDSKIFRRVACGICALLVVLVTFQVGMFVGFHKANHAYRWADSYPRMFGGARGGFMHDFRGDDFFGGHGVVGAIVKIDGDALIIKGSDGVEKIVMTTSTTSIVNGRTKLNASNLKIDDSIVVIGTPKEDGSILAKMIRVFTGDERPMMQRRGR